MRYAMGWSLLGALVGAVLTWALLLVLQPVPEPMRHHEQRVTTAEVMGKCLQGQQVLYRVDRGRAAESCAYDLATNRTRFFSTWRNYTTEEGSW